MIGNETLYFPMNVCNVIAVALEAIDPDVKIYRRPLRTTDEAQSVSVVPVDWIPQQQSLELGRPPEPTIQRYTIAVQAMIKDMEEVSGIARHSNLSAKVRHMLYRDLDLEIALPTVSVKIGSTTETLKKHSIEGQQFMNNQAPRGGFVYLSTAEFWFETQIS
jgi:hypothetical protein